MSKETENKKNSRAAATDMHYTRKGAAILKSKNVAMTCSDDM